MMTLKTWVLTLTLALTAPSVLAQTPSDETIQKYMELTEAEKLLDINHEIILQQNSENLWRDILPKATVENQTIRNQAIDIFTEFDDNVKKRVHTPDMRKRELSMIHRALKQNYTQEELDALIQFYTSPMGRQILSKQASYYEQVSRDLVDFSDRIYNHAIQAELPNTLKKIGQLPKLRQSKLPQKNTPAQ